MSHSSLYYSTQLIASTGFRIPFGRKFAINLEAEGSKLIDQSSFAGHGDLLIGGQYGISDKTKVNLTYSVAALDGGKSDSFRIITGMKILPGYEMPTPPVIVREVVHEVKILKKVVTIIEKCPPIPYQKNYYAREHVLRASHNMILFDIIYTSIGIATDKWEHTFLPFQQADISTARKFVGTGLGLSISKKIMIVDDIKDNQDLFFMDVQMPAMDGREAVRKIRCIENARKIAQTPIVALTAQAYKEERDECIQVSFDVYLAKPFKKYPLISMIAQAFGSSNTQAA